MSNTVFEISVPSTSFTNNPSFEMKLGRLCTLTYSYDTEDGRHVSDQMSFDGVEAFKCTYYTANSIDVFEAYDRVLDLGRTDWLKAISKNLIRSGTSADQLKHLQIMFDDGPCYEFVCRSFDLARTEK